MLKVLYVASEAVPFVKTGGLADVAGSLPQALRKQDVDVRVMLPKYAAIPEEFRSRMEHVYHGEIPVAWRQKYVGVEKLEYEGVTWYFIDNEEYFGRDSFYGYDDDVARFSFFSRAALSVLAAIDFWPDVIHTNDWHTALINVLLRLEHMGDERYEHIRTLFTIHNLKYQGVFPKNVMADVLGLDWKYFNNGDLEYYDAVNFMKGAIIYSDFISTVSRTYAEEIQYEYFGEGLDGLLRLRSDDLFGIVNGLDYQVYNPKTDRNLVVNYDQDSLPKKLDNKTALQQQLGLPENRGIPMLGMVTRMVEAKGLDFVIRVLDELLLHEDIQFVLLGQGDRVYEDWFRELAWRHPQKVSVNIFFNNELAQRIYAASDLFLMPSMYEPCGIGQLIALRYGAIPVVRATGGLKDTVQPFDKATEEGNGFVFPNYNAHEFLYTIKRAIRLIKNLKTWEAMEKNAMQTDYSWDKSAGEYKGLYERLLKR
ncbi:MAG: glycogen synthase GlgA [Schwartzia sp.]|nr:glycogen synthase GlgA [Schwartzia sp. (in: firmicutes)]